MADKLTQTWNSVYSIVVDRSTEIVAGFIFFVVFFLISKELEKASASLFKKIFKKNKDLGEGIKKALVGPSKIFFRLLGLYWGISIVGLPKSTMGTVTTFFRIATILIICWVIADFMPFITAKIIKANKNSTGSLHTNAVAIQFLSNIFKGIVFAIGAVIVISELGYNINGLVTGIGLSGLTFSLAAQKTATNLFGGFAIITDKPFDVGDRISTPSVDGVVEDITMRSTRIRTFGDTIVVVPNSSLIEEPITNWAKMNKRMVDFQINLLYSTTNKTLKEVCNKIQKMLEHHENVDNELISVKFESFGASSLDVRIIYFTSPTDYDEYLRVIADVNFKIKDIVENAETDFAYPSTTVYMENQLNS